VGGESDFQSAGVRLRLNLCCEDYCGPVLFGSGAANRVSRRLDFLIGYRFLQLDENFGLRVNTTTPMGAFNIRDSFRTKNDFHGAEVGTLWEWTTARWSLELLGKLAIGNNQQRVSIDGSTVITPSVGAVANLPGGLLALRSNIGDYRRSEFAVIPELGATIGFRLTDRLRATLGYTFIYFSRVVRPGEQIDRSVNPDLLPPEAVPVIGPLRPVFAFNDTPFWAQGVSVGLDYRW